MKYNFDVEISRKNSNSVKWEFIQGGEDLLQWQRTDDYYGENRVLPMWVADMDFPCPEPVVKAIEERARHGIFGYSEKDEAYLDALRGWMQRRHGWTIDPQWICTTTGVVPALHMLVPTFVKPGEKVLVQTPVYYPFFSAIETNGAEILGSPLKYTPGTIPGYEMDFDDLEAKASRDDVTLAILSNPHNPVGRVWTREELLRFAEICHKHNVLVVADEIHGDLILKNHCFTPFATLGKEHEQNSIVCTAPSKTFNLAGLQTSNILIPNPKIRASFEKTLKSNGVFGVNPFGIVALKAAYTHGEEWLEQVLDYVEANLEFMMDFVAEHMPQITVIRPQGTYLVWFDCRNLGLTPEQLKELMLNKARVFLDEGFIFGSEGEGFERINIACPRSILAEALQRIAHALPAPPAA